MKKLFILTPLMLLTSIIYCADISSINVMISTGPLGKLSKPLRLDVDLNQETFQELANKIYNSDLMKKPEYNGLIIKQFETSNGEYAANNRSTLNEAGVCDEDELYAEAAEDEELLVKWGFDD